MFQLIFLKVETNKKITFGPLYVCVGEEIDW